MNVDNLVKYLKDEEYLISFMDNKIHIFNYKEINKLSEDSVIINFKNKKLKILGKNFILSKMQKKELLIIGEVLKVEFV